MSHTPGPWMFSLHAIAPEYSIWTADDKANPKHIATVSASPPNRALSGANARLIAAAPELLEALRDIEKWAEQATHTKAGEQEHFGGELRACFKIARAAIAKAEAV